MTILPTRRHARRVPFVRAAPCSFIVNGENAALIGALARYTRGDTKCSPKWTCDCVLQCVHCSLYRLAEREADLRKALRVAPAVVFVTFTFSHRSPALRDEWDQLDAIRAGLTERGSWSRFKKRHGITGYAISSDITRSPDGWHPHMHAVFVLNAPPTPKAFRKLQKALTARCVTSASKVGTVAAVRHQDISQIPNTDHKFVLDYMTKLSLLRNEIEDGSAPPGYFLKRTYEDFSDLDSFLLWYEYKAAAKGRTLISQYGSARGDSVST